MPRALPSEQFQWHLALLQEYRPLMDWKVVAAAPLVIENQLPVRGTYLIWETPRVRHRACSLSTLQHERFTIA